jgi:alkanesulfonate monooxygenase
MTSRLAAMPDSLDVFSTCPQSGPDASAAYRKQVVAAARWAEQYGCKGILVYADNSLVDPWLVSQIIAENTERISPLIAVQPVYMHPYSTAKMIASLACLYGRRVYLNMIAGGFRNDLLALADPTPHDSRYARLVEYTTVVLELTGNATPLSYRGQFYQTENLKLTPALHRGLQPGLMVSGSSDAGVEAARVLGATCIHYPRPVEEYGSALPEGGMSFGLRIGIISRSRGSDAWEVAHARFPEDRKGKLLHEFAMKVSDSQWHKQLSGSGSALAGRSSPYWLGPFENYRTFCPYLVGDYEVVGSEISKYIRLGYRTFILDIPAEPEDLMHSAIAFELAVQSTAHCRVR